MYYAVLRLHRNHNCIKFVKVPEGQGIDLDDGREWIHPHLDSEYHLVEFIHIEVMKLLLPYTLAQLR